MEITKDEVLHVAKLARLALDEKSVETFATQIADILQYVHTLEEVDTTGIAPTSHAISLTNALRDDNPANQLTAEKALANAPDKDNDTFIVPKIIGDPS